MQALCLVLAVKPAVACASPTLSRFAVPGYRRAGDTDDTAATIRAMALGGITYFPAGGGSGPGGTYVLDAVPLRARSMLEGDGPRSILTPAREATAALRAMSQSPDQVLDDISLRNFRLEGSVSTSGFREHYHLVSMSGVSDVLIENIEFAGFSGDGLYLGAEHQAVSREPRTIRRIVVRHCLFDGVNNDNRNGISVTGGTDITIDRCRFWRCTRSNMPGPIDFEPDAYPFYSLRRLTVTNCQFEACGGNVGQIGFFVPPEVPLPQDVRIEGNSFRDYRGTGGDIVLAVNREPGAGSPSMNFLIEGNEGVGGNSGFRIYSGKGVVIRSNRWTEYKGHSHLGFNETKSGVRDIVVSDQFLRCGSISGLALAIHKGSNIALRQTVFRGTGNGRPTSAPVYLGPGRIRGLSMIDNDWRDNPASAGMIILERDTDLLPGTTRLAGNSVSEGRSIPSL